MKIVQIFASILLIFGILLLIFGCLLYMGFIDMDLEKGRWLTPIVLGGIFFAGGMLLFKYLISNK